MSLREVNIPSLVNKQVLFKLKAQAGIYVGLMSLQLIALLFSFNGFGQSSTSSSAVRIVEKVYTGDLFVVFSIIWILFSAYFLSQKASLNYDFIFVSNRLVFHLSNIIVLFILGLIGSLCSLFMGLLLRVIFRFTVDNIAQTTGYFILTPHDLLLLFIVTFLYILLIGSVGYLFGTLVQLFKPALFLVPALVIGFIRFGGYRVIEFFVTEHSLFLFSSKVIVTALILYLIAMILSNRMEVRKS